MDLIEPTERTMKLRKQILLCPMMAELPSHTWGPRRDLLLAEGWVASAGELTTRLRRAASHAHRLDHSEIVIGESELIVGCPDLSALTEDEEQRLKQIQAARTGMPLSRGTYDHMAMDYEKLIEVGVNGLIAELEQRRKGLNPQLPESIGKDEFYQGCLLELGALLRFAERYAERARKMAESAPAPRASELREIANIMTRVPAGPAKTFREALQTIHFYTFMLWGDYQMGRPDQFLIDLYRADLAAGRLTPESAQELIDCYCFLYSTNHPKGSAVGFMVGGRNRAGRAVHNELTYMFINSIAHTRMAYPSIGLCVHEETPEDLLDLAVDMLAKGYSHPAIFNDEAITRGLMDLGLPERDARNYVHSSCVEITPCTQSGCWVFSPVINTPALLLEVMRDATECDSVEELMETYEQRLREKVLADVGVQKMLQLERSRNGSDNLLSSCLVNDCLKKGKAIDEGGANYNFIMPTFLGMANLVDSIIAIKALVFEEQDLTMSEFHQILMDDFKSNEPLHKRIINKLPHFGNNDPETNALMRAVSEMIVRSCEGIVNLYGDKAIPGAYTYLQHVAEGKKTPATPDGRRAHTALAAASSPVQGRDISGPTAAIMSSTCWDQQPFMGGVAINFKFQPMGDATRSSMKAVIKTAMDQGGLQVQVNCVSRETLLDAREHPEDHRDLLVRIGGYSDFYTLLSPEMQDEILARTGHG
ncbi:MAG: pyruvate formate lyase family protein [Armatimonadia bacterium]